MNSIQVTRWAAWSPGIESEGDWRAWAREPRALASQGAPDLRFLPALQRRRCDQLSRMVLHVANEVCEDAIRGGVTCVFASRFGAFSTTVSLLENLAAGTAVSPARFSHSVHNTPAGLFSIWSRNRQASVSLAARADTFGHGFLEAICSLHRERRRPVLFVTGDEPIPDPLGSLSDAPQAAYALGILLEWGEGGEALGLQLAAAEGESTRHDWPDGLEFLRWWIAGDPILRLVHPPRAWVWTRDN